MTPLGADKPEAIDVRIVSATNLDEARLFDPAVFRPDLLFRLNTIVIRVPPLRERRDDIPALLAHYLALYEGQYQRPARTLADGALDQLCRFDWPGNVRALRHACERAVILGSEAQYRVADFGLGAGAAAAAGSRRRRRPRPTACASARSNATPSPPRWPRRRATSATPPRCWA